MSFLPFSAKPGLHNPFLAMPSAAHHVPRAPTARQRVQRSVCNAHPVLTASRLVLLHSHLALPVPPLHSATAQVLLMCPPVFCAPQAPIHLYQPQPLVCLANPVLTPSPMASKTATRAGPAPTGCSRAPARGRCAARAPLGHFQTMDRTYAHDVLRVRALKRAVGPAGLVR